MSKNNIAGLSGEPIVLEPNRVQRFYPGGKLLSLWQGSSPAEDNFCPEDMLISTVPYQGLGEVTEKGISLAKVPGGSMNLYDIINTDSKGFLGERYWKLCRGHSGVLARVGDSEKRLIIQCHPTEQMARRYLGQAFGKTEAWYIAETREAEGIKPYACCGFKENVTREAWARLFAAQDIEGMLASMHRFELHRGDVMLIPAGMPHAMGPGALFVEVHEPSDVTVRTERSYLGKTFTEEELHFGLGFGKLLDFFDYATYTEEEARTKCFPRPGAATSCGDGEMVSLITYEDTPCFEMKKLMLHGGCRLPDFDGHYIMVTLKGNIILKYNSGQKTVQQGRGVFIPANVHALTVEGIGELIMAYPFKLEQSNSPPDSWIS